MKTRIFRPLSTTYHLPSTKSGFTIVELLVVIVVIGVLAAITIVAYTGISQKAVTAAIAADLDSTSRQLKLDQVIGSAYPTTLAAANGGRGIPACSGTTTCQYDTSNHASPQTFCLAITENGKTYRITNDSAPVLGDCLNYGLAASYDIGNSSSYPGSGTVLTDLSGNGNNGTLVNGIGYSAANGGVLTFDGVDDYISATNPLNQTQTGQAWTVNAIIKLSTATAATIEKLIDFNSGVSLVYGASFRPLLYLNSSPNDYYDYGTYNLKDDAWHTVSFVFQNSTAKREIYIDGTNVAITGPNQTSTPIGLVGTMKIGQLTLGSIGYISIYNRDLPATEIQQIFSPIKGRYGL